MFKAAGTFDAKITEVKFAEPKFAQGANDFDICIHVVSETDTDHGDWWRGEMSQNYGRGNFATMTQTQITMKTLHAVGFEGEDLSTIEDQLVGKIIPVTIKQTEKDGKVYYNVQYIGAGGGGVKEIDKSEMQKRLSALTGGGSAESAVKHAAPSPFTSGKNPFQ